MKKVVRNIIFSVLTLYLSIACKNYTADIDEYLSYWTTEASIAGYVFNTATQTDAEGALCVSSKDPVTITFTVRNPKNFDFKMPGESDAPADIITFPHLQNAADVSALQAGDDYVFKKISGSTLELTYTPAFLRKHEWSSGNIAPAIMLYTNDGRVFKQTITLELKVNTPPPTIKYYAVAKTSAAVPGEDAYYVLCLQVPDMDTKITGGLLHKDIAGIEINGIRYPLSIDEEQQGFVKPENDAFLDITDVVPLDEHDAADIPSGWVLYFKTDAAVKTGSAKKDYTVKLTDTNGFTSSELKASTSPNKLPKEEWKVTKGDPAGEKSGTAAEPIIIGADSDGAAVSVSSKIPNTVVHCTLTEIGQEAEPEQTGIVSVTVDMPLKGKNEKTYKLEYYTDGEGFAATAPQTVYYNILLKHTVTFNLAGGNIGGKTDAITMTGTPGTPFTQPADPAKDGYNFSGWLPSLPSSPVFPKADTEYTAQWTKDGNTPYKIEHYQQNIDDDDYTLVSADTQSLKGEAEALIAVARKHYEGFTFDHQEPSAPTIAATGDTVVRVYYNRKEITLTFRLNGGIIGGKPDYVIGPGKFGKSFEPPIPTRDGYTPNGWKPALPSPPAFPAEDTIYTALWKANTYTVTFDSKGGGSIPAQKVQYGSKISKPADPTAPAGYSFQNWCTDEGCTTAWNFSSGTVKGDMTLYAKWTPLKVTYTVKHSQQNIDDNNVYTVVSDDTQTLSGYTDSLTQAKAKANGYPGFDPLPIEQKQIAGDGSTVVEVKYNRKEIRLTFKLNGGTIGGSHSPVIKSGKFGTTFIAPADPTRDGYTFNGWNPPLPSPFVFPAANAEYTAQWTANQYKVQFNGNGNTGGSMSDQTFTYGTSQALQLNGFARTGYTFKGWARSQTATEPSYTDGQRVENLTVTNNAVVQLYAVWQIKTYTVEFKVDGGQGGKLIGLYDTQYDTASGTEHKQFTDVPYNSEVRFNAEPALGYEVDSWTGATPEAGDNKQASLKVQDNVTVTVKFKQQAAPITTWEALRTAVQNASDGTVIEIAKNLTYNIAAAGSNKSTITVEKDITIRSKGSTPYILDANGRGADVDAIAPKVIGIFEVTSGKTLTLENVILTKTEKYAVYVDHNSSLTMKNVTINNCKTPDNAAGIYFNKGKDLILENCRIEKCKGKGSQSSGGIDIQAPKGTVSIKNTTIEKCEATGTYSAGGGIHLYKGTCTLEKVTIQECKAPKGGGIFVSENAECILKQAVTISKNEATGTNSNGGGIFVSKNADSTQFGTLTIEGTSDNPVTISKNKAEYGGGLYNFGTVTIKNAKIEKNEVPHHGGGMVNAGTCTMDSVKLENNKAGSEGGGIYSSKVLTLKDTTVTGNEATMSGGAIQIATADSVFNMSGSTVITVEPSGGPGKPSKNDIYLTNTAFITLTGALTAAEKIARITLNSSGGYKNNREIVKGGSGFTIPSGYENKFTITDKIGSQPHWKLIYQSNALKLKQN
ncbi:InlB B-repeat-containing protein [Treponema vincentii]|uniref:InlB B-repeat-containing protein n=1 Tax=Treponema vincentii TaxID=69710 RepID=UPI0035F57A82